MRMLRFLPVALLLALALLAAGCGGSTSVPTSAVAVVGKDTITKAQFNDLLASAKSQYAAKKVAFPKPGTTNYKQLQDRVVNYLVELSELQQKANDLGVTIGAKDITTQLAALKKQVGGTEKAYRQQLKASGLTEAQLKQNIRANLLSQRIYQKVTSKLTVTNGEIAAYYQQHQSAYKQAASRSIRHILVKTKALADSLYKQLQAGASFATLAKKYSQDPGSAKLGGKLDIQQGQTVAEFDKMAFSLKTNQLSQPVHTTYGWHIIQALSPITAAHQTPLSKVRGQIRTILLGQKKTTEMQNWLTDLKKSYAKSIRYQAGYAPTTVTTSVATAPATTTTQLPATTTTK
jgi:parvulin-like peptidyl-prolyl isomerase